MGELENVLEMGAALKGCDFCKREDVDTQSTYKGARFCADCYPGIYKMITLDERDSAMLATRQAYLLGRTAPDVGDWVLFDDGTERRISHVWDFPEDRNLSGYQTSNPGGSYHLGPDYVSFSGGLHPSQSWGSMIATTETRPARCWFFHHDHWTAHNGVDVLAVFRVWRCNEAPKD